MGVWGLGRCGSLRPTVYTTQILSVTVVRFSSYSPKTVSDHPLFWRVSQCPVFQYPGDRRPKNKRKKKELEQHLYTPALAMLASVIIISSMKSTMCLGCMMSWWGGELVMSSVYLLSQCVEVLSLTIPSCKGKSRHNSVTSVSVCIKIPRHSPPQKCCTRELHMHMYGVWECKV